MKDKQLELIEHAIGEVFEYNGMDLKVVDGTPCTGCVFCDSDSGCFDDEKVLVCNGGVRKDGKDVIFKLATDNTAVNQPSETKEIKKREYHDVGEEFEFHGMRLVAAESHQGACENCVLLEKCLNTDECPECIHYNRKDRKNVFFKFASTDNDGTANFTKEIPADLYDRLDYLGIIPNDVRSHNVGSSNYAEHTIQPWSVWLDYPELTSWDHDILKRVLRTKADNPRELDYEKIIQICQERLRQMKHKKQ